ncbi:MAG: HK97 gp10 family phage protein [Hyphomicrobium sp.]
MADKILGERELRRNLAAIAREAPEEVGQALFQEAQIEATESRRRTPVEFGTLRDSHDVKDPVFSGDNVSVSIEVGGPAAPYGFYVHEDLEAHHELGQAKFLESTIAESRRSLGRRLAKRISVRRMARGI